MALSAKIFCTSRLYGFRLICSIKRGTEFRPYLPRLGCDNSKIPRNVFKNSRRKNLEFCDNFAKDFKSFLCKVDERRLGQLFRGLVDYCQVRVSLKDDGVSSVPDLP